MKISEKATICTIVDSSSAPSSRQNRRLLALVENTAIFVTTKIKILILML